MQCFYFLDIPLMMWFHQHQEATLRTIFKQITTAGESHWYIILGLLLFIIFRKHLPKVASQGALLASSVVVSGIAALLFKTTFGRARPKLFLSDGIYGFNFFEIEHAWISFPSGHSATAFSVAMALALCYPRWRWLWFAGGALIALSRLILTQHYLSDVIAGSILGAFSTLLLYHHIFKATLHAPTNAKEL